MDWERYHELEALDRSGCLEEALAGFQELLATASAPRDRAAVLLSIAGCLAHLGKDSEARRAASQALALPEKTSDMFAWALLFGAGLEISLGNCKKALADLDRLESDFPALLNLPENQESFETAERMRGIALYRLHRAKEALPFLERAAARNVERETVLYYLGRCCYDLGALEKAQASLREALTLNLHPLYQPGAHYVLGLSYHWRGQNARAAEEYRWCLENDTKGLVPKRSVLTALVDASKALGMQDETARYSEMLRDA
jgi:tetratricopeptide (TPR) repeat protein